MTETQAAILEEIASLLAEPERGETSPSLEQLEDTLTSGYAHALELEAERWRLDRRIDEVTARLGDADGAGADELAALARQASTTDRELLSLRSLLASLRSRASSLRSAVL